MKAIVYEKYGPPEVLQLRAVEKPTPKDGQVLIQVRAAAVTIYDVRARAVRVPSPLFYLPARMHFGHDLGPRPYVAQRRCRVSIHALEDALVHS